MKYILLDTCVLLNCTLMNTAGADPDLLVALVDRMRDAGAKLLLPDVVSLEYARKVPEELSNIKKRTKTFRDSVTTSVLPGPDVSSIHSVLDKIDSDREAAAKRVQEYFERLSTDHDMTIPIALNGEVIAEAVKYVLAGEKPSSGLERGLLDPDSLIVASAALFARSQGLTRADTLIICSDNHKDFAEWGSDQNVHVLSETIAARLPCTASYFKSPRLLLEKELDTNTQADKSLTDALDAYDQVADTLSSISRVNDALENIMSVHTIDPAVLERMSRVYTIDPAVLDNMSRVYTIDSAVLENMNRMFTIDSAVLENMNRMFTIDPAVLENMNRMFTIDPAVLENMNRMCNIDPESVRRLREFSDARDLDVGSDAENIDEEDDHPEAFAGPGSPRNDE